MMVDTAGYHVDGSLEIIGFANGETNEYVMFQHVSGEDDLHFEFNDQSNGNFNCVDAVTFSADRMTVRTRLAPGGTLSVAFAGDIEGRDRVEGRLAEILAEHGVEVSRA